MGDHAYTDSSHHTTLSCNQGQIRNFPLILSEYTLPAAEPHKKHGKAQKQHQTVTQLFVGNHFYQKDAGDGRNDDIAVAPYQAG